MSTYDDLRAAVEALADGLEREADERSAAISGQWTSDFSHVTKRRTAERLRALLATPAPEAARCICDGAAHYSNEENAARHPFLVNAGCPVHTRAPEAASDCTCGASEHGAMARHLSPCPLTTPAPEAARACCDYAPTSGPCPAHEPPAPDLPTTVQADRDAGQVRLTEGELSRLADALASTNPHEKVRVLFERILAARQSDPDATERVEWGVRLPSGRVIPPRDRGWATRREAEIEAGVWQGETKILRRTVTTGEWIEVGE